MKRLSLIAGLVLCGCPHHYAPTHREIVGPDGGPMYEATCSGANLSLGDCFNEAARTCGGAYDVIGQDGDAGGAKSVTSRIGDVAITRTTVNANRELFFKCRNMPPAPPPEPLPQPKVGDDCTFEESCGPTLRCRDFKCVEP